MAYERPTLSEQIEQMNTAISVYLGTSDPYCKIIVGREQNRTTTLHKCLNPKWNEEFEL